MSDKSIGFVGKAAVNVYGMAVLVSSLRLYAKSRIRMNRHYTPTAMLASASQVTGTTYKRGQYAQAADDVQAVLEQAKAQLTRTETAHSITFA